MPMHTDEPRETDPPLPTPRELCRALAVSTAARDHITQARQAMRDILRGRADRLLVVVGPCSIHDPASAMEYAHKLARLQHEHAGELLLCMRSYFEKPRTSVGWKGLLNDPHLDGRCDMAHGLTLARGLLSELAELRLPTAVEALDPLAQPYLSDLVSWTAIGARTTESQTHRELASGLGMPVGFKNGTDGSVDVAIHAMRTAARAHTTLGVSESGQACVVRTRGNPSTHVVLRGDRSGPNYGSAQVERLTHKLAQAGLPARVMIDCSHDNSRGDHRNQWAVVADVAAQVAAGSTAIMGAMIESHLVAGRQTLETGSLVYGQSITDACVDFSTTEGMLDTLASAVHERRYARARRSHAGMSQLSSEAP
jgi:3-deoxy-7-phosphoheptulonate synthase